MCLLSITLLIQMMSLDWEKEARKIEYRLRKTNTNNPSINSTNNNINGVSINNPLHNNHSIRQQQQYVNINDIEIAIPSIGSRAMGGLLLIDLVTTIRTNNTTTSIATTRSLLENDLMNELEYIEYGNIISNIHTTNNTNSMIIGSSSSSVDNDNYNKSY